MVAHAASRSLLFARDLLCALLTGVVIPTEEQIRAWENLHPFLVSMSDFEGVYGNMSESSAVFRYTTAACDEAVFWGQVEQQLVGTSWTRLPSAEEVRRFERVRRKEEGDRFAYAQEVRVRYAGASRRVTVAWVGGESSKDISTFAQCRRSEFAERVVWPNL